MNIPAPVATPTAGLVNSIGAGGNQLGTILAVVGAMLSFIVLWSGFKHIEFSSPIKAAISVLDVALLIAGVISLGRLGVFVAVGANMVGFLAYGIYLAIQRDDILTNAAVQSNTT